MMLIRSQLIANIPTEKEVCVMPLIATVIQGATFSLNGEVEQYPYRTASALDRFMQVERAALSDFERQLAKAAGKGVDNHTVYKVMTEGGGCLYVMFHDDIVHFGFGVKEGFW